jgi:hypothetical protein
LDLKLRWGFETAVELPRALKFLTEEFAETEANKQTFGEVDSCCGGASTKTLLTAACRFQSASPSQELERTARSF